MPASGTFRISCGPPTFWSSMIRASFGREHERDWNGAMDQPGKWKYFSQSHSASNVWQVLCKPGRRIRPGDRAIFGRGEFVGTFQESLGDLHVLELESAESLLKSYGQMPLPPYIGREPTPADDASYQTVFGAAAGGCRRTYRRTAFHDRRSGRYSFQRNRDRDHHLACRNWNVSPGPD